MGVAGSNEPDLPSAYVAVRAAYQRLAKAERAHRHRRTIEEAMAAEYGRLERLRAELRIEQAEVGAAESLVRRRGLARSRRRRLERLAAERADVNALRSEIAARHQAWEELASAQGSSTVLAAANEVEAARRQLDAALTSWQAEHQVAGSVLGNRIDTLERLTGEISALSTEVDEAAFGARQARAALLVALRAVARTPTMWNPKEPTGLGANVAWFISRSRVTAAQTAVGRFQQGRSVAPVRGRLPGGTRSTGE